jgi:hypothetical protein
MPLWLALASKRTSKKVAGLVVGVCRTQILLGAGRICPFGPLVALVSTTLVLGIAGVLPAEVPIPTVIDTTFGCYPSSKAADVVPKGAPTIWHKSTACHLAHAL